MKKNLIALLLILFAFLGNPSRILFAQNLLTLKGEVQDESGKPIPGASVAINFDAYRFSTDKNGRFEVKLQPKIHAFTVRMVGFLTENFALTLSSDSSVTIVLKEVINQLDQVVVTSDRNNQNIIKPIGIAQLNTKILKKIPAALGETDLLRGLQMLPGVSTVGEASNGINVRGGTTDQNLLLLDETPIFNPTHMFGLFSVFPPDGVARADLYKGNVPSRFGGRAASVLDVTLENPALDSFRLETGIGIVSSRLLLDIPIKRDKLGFLITGRGAFTDFLLPIVSEKNFSDVKANFQELSLKGLYRASEKHSFFLSGYFSNDFFQTTLLGTIGNINAAATQNQYSTLNLALRHFYQINKKVALSSSVVYVDYLPNILLPEIGVDNTVRFESGISFRQVRSTLDFQNEKHQIKIGISSAYTRINPGELVPGNSPSINPQKTNLEYSLESALFFEDNLKLSKLFTASLGLRYANFLTLGPTDVRTYAADVPISSASVTGLERFERNKIVQMYGGFEPRIGVRYDVSNDASIKIAYNLMRQFVQTVTNTTTPLPTSRWKTADKFIKPQVSQSVSAGWFQNFKQNIYEFSLEGYYRLTNNVLDFKQGANLLLQQFPETELLAGQNRSYGIETMLSKKKGDWTGWLTYTFARSLNKIDDPVSQDRRINGGNWFRANYDRPHTLNVFANLNYNKFHNFSFTFTLSTGRPFSRPTGIFAFQNQNYPIYPERNNDRLPTYHRLDFSWNILTTLNDIKRWKNYWTFSIYNIYGRGNPYSIFFNNKKGALDSYALEIFSSPIPSLTYNGRF